MESPRSEISSDSASSSSADSSAADSSLVQTLPTMSEQQETTTMATTVLDNDDSASDISMSADSDDGDDGEEVEPNVPAQLDPPPQKSDTTVPSQTDAQGSKKRKFGSSSPSPNGQIQNEHLQEVRKRFKPDDKLQNHWTPEGRLLEDKSLLPAEIWHHIFTFCPPKALGNLLRVNKSFNAYLDPASSGIPTDPLSRSSVQPLSPESIWRASKRLFLLPGMPVPISGKSELIMWKLACGSTCQFCGKKRQDTPTLNDQWHPGPGENGVVPIWSFGIRTCGSCLQKETLKEIDLLLSSSIPSPLMAALTFVFVTNELHVIPPTTLQNGQQPPAIQITKHFSKQQVEEIKKEFEEVKLLGSAAAEEWLKGLNGRGQERRNDAARWERWELMGGVEKMRKAGAESNSTSGRQHSNGPPTNGAPPTSNGNISTLQLNNSLPKPVYFPTSQPQQLPQPIHSFATNPPPRYDSPAQNGFGFPPRSHAQPKHERTKEEVAELKAARRTEIERRCMLLDPPITAGVLAHMSSFQAAIQIIQPLNDGAWEVLKPRLLSQREEAEQRENDRLAQTRVVQERFDERRIQDSQAKSDSKDIVDREWDDIQAPLRARIGGYADEIVRDGWNGGDKVTYETCPQFAAEVLIYVRKRFYAEVAKDEAAIRATGREPEVDPPNGPYTRKLILENMKWVFDTKVKPHTEQYRKELFLCNACEYVSKYYGFEGVIQHYAAKHTSALSVGSVVVHWKSEWPEHPPFNPDPTNAVVKPYFPAAPNNGAPYAANGPPMQQNYGYGGYQPVPVSTAMPAQNPHVYQENHGAYYSHPQFGDQYSAPQHIGYNPPQTYPETSQGYQPPQFSIAPPSTNITGYHGPPQDYSQGYGSQYQQPGPDMYTSPNPGPLYPATVPEVATTQQAYPTQAAPYGSAYTQAPSYPQDNFAQQQQPQPVKTEEYVAQLQNIARNAREIWNSIGGLKEIPGSLKVYTIIYHLLQKFRATFNDDPPLSMIVDGLSSNKDMRPVRNVNGLLCKACSLGMAGAISASQKKHFSFPQLVNHFHSVHEQGIPQGSLAYIPDWTKDMVELPDISKLSPIVTAPGFDRQKKRLFTEALPELIAPPESNTNGAANGTHTNYGDVAHEGDYPQLAPSLDNHDKYYTTSNVQQDPNSGFDNGEYDPRNPVDISREVQSAQRVYARNEDPRETIYTRDSRPPVGDDPGYRYRRQDGEANKGVYKSEAPPIYNDERLPAPSHSIPVEEYRRVVVRGEPSTYQERPVRYRDPDVEYRVKRDPPTLYYDDPEPVASARDYRAINAQSYSSNRREMSTIPVHETAVGGRPVRGAENPASQQSRIFEVVAQIEEQAKQARERQPVREERIDAGSEDGELRAENNNSTTTRLAPADEASSAAERFLSSFRPGEVDQEPASEAEPASRYVEDQIRDKWEGDRREISRIYQPMAEPQRRPREQDENSRVLSNGRRHINPGLEEVPQNSYVVHEREPQSRDPRSYTYEDRYVGSAPEQVVQRDRSPELVDRRYKLNNVVYRDERQASSGAHRTPSRYARYESVRLENDRGRSRSPVYVKMTQQHGQYRERSPSAHPLRQEPIYGTRTPPPAGEEAVLSRPPPRQEYYRVYTDEPRPRESQYTEAFKYVRVSDPQGDYMIRVPVRREAEPVYRAYEDDAYGQQPVYESRPPPPRTNPAFYEEEEYDPRHPEPPPAPVRQVRYP